MKIGTAIGGPVGNLAGIPQNPPTYQDTHRFGGEGISIRQTGHEG
jgi:hypothetical protein